MRNTYYTFLWLFLSFSLYGQSTYLPLDEDYYHWIDRYEIKSGRVNSDIFTTVKPYKRSDVVHFMDSLQLQGVFSSKSDEFIYQYLQNDSWEWSSQAVNDSRKSLWGTFYKKKSDFYAVREPHFDLHINPVIYVGVGKDSRLDPTLFINTRGVEVRGMVDQKVGFYTYLADNQAILPGYVQDYQSMYWIVPHQGFWKRFKDNGIDFLSARGYISFEATQHINVQVGYDRFFNGNGYRSLVQSDFAPPGFFFKGDVKVWKLNYLFSLSQMKASVPGSNQGSKPLDEGYPNKFVAFHHLSLNIGKKLNVGVFETVVFSPEDSLGSGEFELAYLNPIIFYRAIEQQNGSSDNVILGFDVKWHPFKRTSFYSQVILDEFVLDEIKAGNGWWANKFGVQVGGKYVDAFGIDNLDFQIEGNIMRPYVYSHNTPYANYSHFNQSLAHPLGANFTEAAFVVHYMPIPRLNLVGKVVITQLGRDGVDENWGGDILKINSTREMEYGNVVDQGRGNDILFSSFAASWMLKHNLFVDLQFVIRESSGELPEFNTHTTSGFLALRWNIARRLYDF